MRDSKGLCWGIGEENLWVKLWVVRFKILDFSSPQGKAHSFLKHHKESSFLLKTFEKFLLKKLWLFKFGQLSTLEE